MVELQDMTAETEKGATGADHENEGKRVRERSSPPTVFARKLLLAADDP
jgi:hypothetical protein